MYLNIIAGVEKRGIGTQFTQKLKAKNQCELLKNEDRGHTMVEV